MEQITHCLSVREPWVTLIMIREKTIEYRSRKLIARPPETIAIATSKAGAGDYLPGGCIIGVARISAVVPWDDMNDGFWERSCLQSPVGLGKGYAMMISGFAACEPVPVRGNVGLYNVPEGWEPRYAETPDQLREWWNDARVWSDGPANDDERELMEAILAYGIGWRIDD